MLLGEILLLRGYISKDELERALRLQSRRKRPLGQLLLDDRAIEPGQLETALREQYWRANGYWVIDDRSGSRKIATDSAREKSTPSRVDFVLGGPISTGRTRKQGAGPLFNYSLAGFFHNIE